MSKNSEHGSDGTAAPALDRKSDTGLGSKNSPGHGPSSGKDMRSLSNILVQPKGQLRYAFMLFGAGILMMVTIVSYLLLSFNKTIESLHALYQIDATVVDHLQMSLYSTLVMVIIFGVVLAAVTISIGIALSHRIFGPVIPLRRHVEALIEGKYESRVLLRKKDEFQDLAAELNRLAATLEHK